MFKMTETTKQQAACRASFFPQFLAQPQKLIMLTGIRLLKGTTLFHPFLKEKFYVSA